MLDHRTRYLQIAFNYDLSLVRYILPRIPESPNILIEAGTPFIKREGLRGIYEMRRFWGGLIVADMKISDGAINEVDLARQAGAGAVTIMGSAPIETVNMAIKHCEQINLISMVDLLGVKEPLHVFRGMLHTPDAAVLHLGRDEENTTGKLIQYRHINRIHSKYSTLIAAAGGVGLKETHSAIFNGVNIVIVNLVHPGDAWNGISTQEDITSIVNQFLVTMA